MENEDHMTLSVVICYYAQALIGGGIKRWCCLTCLSDVCLSRTSGLRREQRGPKTEIGTEVAHVTRDWDNTFKVKGQGHQAALLTAVLARQAAAAVGVGTGLTVKNCCFVAVCSAAQGASTPTGD